MTHPAHTRTAALAALLAGGKVGDVARTAGVPKQTVSRWKYAALAALRNPPGREFTPPSPQPPREVASRPTQKRARP